jgi:hypothetical protein
VALSTGTKSACTRRSCWTRTTLMTPRTQRLNGIDFLEWLHGKRMLLMGDSMNWNQFESMLCARLYRTRPDVRDARAQAQEGPRLLHLRVHGNNKSVECGIVQNSMEARVIIFLSQYGFHSGSLVFLISMFFGTRFGSSFSLISACVQVTFSLNNMC